MVTVENVEMGSRRPFGHRGDAYSCTVASRSLAVLPRQVYQPHQIGSQHFCIALRALWTNLNRVAADAMPRMCSLDQANPRRTGCYYNPKELL